MTDEKGANQLSSSGHEYVIQSLLDTDLYKFTMMQTVLHQHPAAEVEYHFRSRNKQLDFSECLVEIEQEIAHLCQLRLTEDELNYLGKLDYIKPDFIHFLRLFRLDQRFIYLSGNEGELILKIQGPWLHTILFEVPLLSIISEVYCRKHNPQPDLKGARARLHEKIDLVRSQPEYADFRFSDFGTRRRYSRNWQQEVVQTLAQELPEQFSGTSNLDLARRLNLKPVGTLAHEFMQAFQALGPRLIDSQKMALEAWVHEYRGQLGIALTDVVGMDAFLRDFDLYFAKLFDGLRQDSGDPVEWTEKALAHYQKLNIDPRSKTLVYSDGLTMHSALDLHTRFRKRCKPAFGIGTHLTNDIMSETPINIVLKMTSCNGQAVAKLSDSPGKAMSDDEGYMAYLAQVFEVDIL
ncbi:nicotinate phosphoribosyltransferase [Oceanisphaera avium]|uniref:Nicotinate phosphoribosyltransferase n=1 Tax=Oceanisphaera avium TaxID=1903694 RepID=A0A1Y0D063_9GAMM|nr:nicotinate phosphoribosyltransferase [Oceanisphaera avium]ART80971.1 nicotinate phosphoribosyltransferase [Oceanisphaera avium]